jgi:hypothetical protein
MFVQILGREVTTVRKIAEKHNLKTKAERNVVYDVTKHYDDLHLKIKGQENKKYIYKKIGEKFNLSKRILETEKSSFYFVTKRGYERWLEYTESKKYKEKETETDYLDPIIKLIDERDRYKTLNLKLSKENEELRKCLNGVQKLLKEVTE